MKTYRTRRGKINNRPLITIGFSSHRIETLQAARSLIYIKLLKKEEMIPSKVEKNPHTKDEIRAIELANKFTLTQCEELYKKIRFRNRYQALEIVQNYISSFSH